MQLSFSLTNRTSIAYFMVIKQMHVILVGKKKRYVQIKANHTDFNFHLYKMLLKNCFLN